ncbi:MAG: hypothetical protein WCV50_05655 [Patescibacteria group bacterium]|jgi:hypothetical protein
MQEKIDSELNAINNIIKSLESLDEAAKKRVLSYVSERLGLNTLGKPGFSNEVKPSQINQNAPTGQDQIINLGLKDSVVDIRTLKDQKSPKTATQMAALVAFYLQEYSPENERKEIIKPQDITKYFKQANYPLPKGRPIVTLVNAKNAGYLESVGESAFKLNPVGYNLIAHQLSEEKSSGNSKRQHRAKKK